MILLLSICSDDMVLPIVACSFWTMSLLLEPIRNGIPQLFPRPRKAGTLPKPMALCFIIFFT